MHKFRNKKKKQKQNICIDSSALIAGNLGCQSILCIIPAFPRSETKFCRHHSGPTVYFLSWAL